MKLKVTNIALFIIGLNILAMGTVLFSVGDLGFSALVSVPQAGSVILNITLGQATTLFFAILIIVELILIRKLKLQIILQIVLSFVFGFIVDFYGIDIGLKSIHLVSFISQLGFTLLAIVLTALGIFTMVKADLILIPPDGLVRTISDKFNRKFGMVKLGFDFSNIILTLFIGFLFIGHIEGIGIGTILAVLLVGHLINLLDYLLNKLKKGHTL
ncbi:DUF6198 family protein [Apilactobacillus ozensis]|uniref:DUF6198 family protein n=1 Tax=Apilactobacillus ozensis TaxID=866801 RepID=UPI00200A1F3A|nr:DUF6198 family protein [Apilactobacillus ozensis]MCK8607157.1 DUF6198 family protein [Apilactobacillus ozensis]